MNDSSSLAAPTYFFPLSLIMVFGLPRLAMNLVTRTRHDSVSNDFAILICTVLVVRQMKRQHHLLYKDPRNLSSRVPIIQLRHR